MNWYFYNCLFQIFTFIAIKINKISPLLSWVCFLIALFMNIKSLLTQIKQYKNTDIELIKMEEINEIKLKINEILKNKTLSETIKEIKNKNGLG